MCIKKRSRPLCCRQQCENRLSKSEHVQAGRLTMHAHAAPLLVSGSSASVNTEGDATSSETGHIISDLFDRKIQAKERDHDQGTPHTHTRRHTCTHTHAHTHTHSFGSGTQTHTQKHNIRHFVTLTNQQFALNFPIPSAQRNNAQKPRIKDTFWKKMDDPAAQIYGEIFFWQIC